MEQSVELEEQSADLGAKKKLRKLVEGFSHERRTYVGYTRTKFSVAALNMLKNDAIWTIG